MDGQGNNAYFEQQLISAFGRMSEDDLVQRISDCQMITERLEADPVWHLVIQHANEWVEKLDANWQEIENADQRNYARVLKFAYLHIKTLPEKYRIDLENARKALEMKKNIGTHIPKDYDLETKTE